MPNNAKVVNRRVLIVDDTRSIHDDYRKILAPTNAGNEELDALESSLFGAECKSETAEDFVLDSAYQGEEAVEKVKKLLQSGEQYAVAFVDVRMPPGIDGIETIARIWAHDADIQVVICTAYSDYSWDETFEKLGNTDSLLILKKPFDKVEMQQIASALVRKWNLSRDARMRMEQLEDIVAERTKKVEIQKQELETHIAELQDTRAQLVQSEKMAAIGQLAAGIAHEINNPVGFVKSNVGSLSSYFGDMKKLIPLYGELIEQAKGDGEQIKVTAEKGEAMNKELDIEFMLEDVDNLIRETTDGLDRVKKIVSDLLDFSHINKEELSEEDINDLIDKTISIAWNQLKYKIKINKEYGELPKHRCNGGKLSQVFLILLVNAAQAIDEKGIVTIRTRFGDDKIEIEFEDNGCGISEENLRKIYDPFFTTKGVGEGTGLGLHVAQNIIASHGGKIHANSVVNTGTTFRIELPIAAEVEEPLEIIA